MLPQRLIALLFLPTMFGCVRLGLQPVVGPISGKKYFVDDHRAMDSTWEYFEELRKQYVRTHTMSEEKKQLILNRRIRPGMSVKDVEVSWGLLYRRAGRKVVPTPGVADYLFEAIGLVKFPEYGTCFVWDVVYVEDRRLVFRRDFNRKELKELGWFESLDLEAEDWVLSSIHKGLFTERSRVRKSGLDTMMNR